jgi:hypothetical protein
MAKGPSYNKVSQPKRGVHQKHISNNMKRIRGQGHKNVTAANVAKGRPKSPSARNY